jgi:hypothetical protein
MKTKPLTFLLALTFLFLFSGNSSGMSGNSWLKRCKGTSSNTIICDSWTLGITRMYDLWNQISLYSKENGNYHPILKTCMPKEVTLDQIKRILTKWLNEHPDKSHQEMVFLFVMIMRENFPCDNNSKP